MTRNSMMAALVLSLTSGAAVGATPYPDPLPVEPIPNVLELTPKYPASWIYVQDLHFNSILDGRAAIVDVAAENSAVKGQIPVAQFGTLLPSTTRPDIYVAETFHARLTRGERTDVITIWDKATLKPKGEIALPGGKRGQFVTLRHAFQLTNGEKWALLFNFTPASSVSVIDLDSRTILNEIDLPGCSLIYPTGERGFTSLCADGTMTSIALDAAGKVASSATSKAINDIDHDAMFMTPTMVGRTAWFATFTGSLHGIDLSGPVARDLGSFAMPKEKTAEGEWRPGGWQVISSDPAGRVYVLMNPAGKEGTHKDGGTEVWVVDPARKQRVARVPLANPAISIEVTAQASPLLVASRADGSLDVYDAASGKLQRSIAQVVHDPMTMTAAR
ncbi:amine dehydrogenase large subunit [Rhizorhabdus sp.]|uniref:amine dehydrogenase large subunit n=1 Tax=Rhizorhabdus sp. TaxID=1968843 RepID=UPI0035AEF730